MSILIFALLSAAMLSVRPASVQAQTVAYVSSSAVGPGTLGDSSDPFPTLSSAVNAGADELRINPGSYGENVQLNGVGVIVRSWNGMTGGGEVLDGGGEIEIQGDLALSGAASLTVSGTGHVLSLTGNVDLDGTLDISLNTLELNPTGADKTLVVHEAGDILSSNTPGKQGSGGLIQFTGACLYG